MMEGNIYNLFFLRKKQFQKENNRVTSLAIFYPESHNLAFFQPVSMDDAQGMQ